jgi:hypothetical protein
MDDAYIAGFVDGEGSFHIAFQRNPTVKIGWQAVPEFHISQNGESAGVLRMIQRRLGCGIIKRNHAKNPNDQTYVLVVRNRQHLQQCVIPFFKRHRLFTAKARDFHVFSQVVTLMTQGEHQTRNGLMKIIDLAFQMNGGGRYRRMKKEQILAELGSSETIREAPPQDGGKDIVRTA